MAKWGLVGMPRNLTNVARHNNQSFTRPAEFLQSLPGDLPLQFGSISPREGIPVDRKGGKVGIETLPPLHCQAEVIP
jgi:hypothetical protein